GVAILYGYPERSGDAVYNAAQLLDSKGTRRLNVRKTHLFGAGEKRLYTPGEELSKVVELCGVRLAVLICYDVEFPEAVRTL
ncbi:nitrilase-related carbon-nitrogen hydrolase, partial [Paraburkholderia sp. SIMBA_061]